MKKLTFVSAAVMSALFVSQAFAAPNTITFQGEVTSETCSVAINGNSASPIVLLPTVNKSALATAGDVAGPTTFDIGVSGCTGSTTVTTPISTVFVGNVISADGNLSNVATANAATNVDIQIVDTTSTPINFLTTPTFKAAGDLTLAVAATSASATYTAQYVSVAGNATAGAVEATMQYAVSYD